MLLRTCVSDPLLQSLGRWLQCSLEPTSGPLKQNLSPKSSLLQTPHAYVAKAVVLGNWLVWSCWLVALG